MKDVKTPRCSFCAKTSHEVFLLIVGPIEFICDECVDLCVVIVKNERDAHARTFAGDREYDSWFVTVLE